MKKLNNWFYFLFLTAYMTTNALATEFTHDFIENMAKQKVKESLAPTDEQLITIEVSPIDPRIDIQPCDNELTVNILDNPNVRNINVKISCESSNTWSLFIPVRINRMTPVVVAQQNIAKGSLLTSDNIKVEYLPDYKVRGEVLSDTAELLGAKLVKHISNGSPIYAKNICIVCKGENVTILASSEDFQIKTSGTALSDGVLGEQISIKNNRSGKIISATVSSINNVVVNL